MVFTLLSALFLLTGAICSGGEDGQFALMLSESIGSYRIDQPAAEVEKTLPEKPEKGEEEWWGADGGFHQEWICRDSGLHFDMVANSKGGKQIVSAITVVAPGKLKTAKGIGVGATRGEVLKAYGDEIKEGNPGKDEQLVAGSIYGGIVFTLENDRVVKIFLGAAAE